MRIEKPEIIQNNNALTYQVNVSTSEGENLLWYSLNSKFLDLVSDRSDAALVALLIPAMATGEDIYLDGVVSEKLYYNLTRAYQHILKSIIPSLSLVSIHASEVQPSNYNSTGVMTGFSAGIDSFSVLADHHYADVPDGFRLTHLVYSNVGSHVVTNSSKDARSLFKERFLPLEKTAKNNLNLPLIAIDSNLNNFYKKFSFVQTHTARNASVALLLQQGIRRFMYASAWAYENTFIGSTYSMGYSDPVTLPMLSTETLEAVSVGGEYSRVQKTIQVAQLKDSYEVLDVCVHMDQSKNCSTCQKCLRTLLTLEIGGLIDHYENAFDLYAYQKARNLYIATHILSRKTPLEEEIISFSKDKNFRFPLSSFVSAPVLDSANSLKKTVRKLIRRIYGLIKR